MSSHPQRLRHQAGVGRRLIHMGSNPSFPLRELRNFGRVMTSLSLSFLACKMGLLIKMITKLQGLCEDRKDYRMGTRILNCDAREGRS